MLPLLKPTAEGFAPPVAPQRPRFSAESTHTPSTLSGPLHSRIQPIKTAEAEASMMDDPHGQSHGHDDGGGDPSETFCTTQPPVSGLNLPSVPDHHDTPTIQLPLPSDRRPRRGEEGDAAARPAIASPFAPGPPPQGQGPPSRPGPLAAGGLSASIGHASPDNRSNWCSGNNFYNGYTSFSRASPVLPPFSAGPPPCWPRQNPPRTRYVANTKKGLVIMSGPPPSTKRSAQDGSDSDGSSRGQNGAKMKLPRLDRGDTEDFSLVVKNRLQQYTRTGQACDRCKVRKIRCDALPEGCSHCINLNLECNVTDRVTGRTERRGYLQELEREKSGMMEHIRSLENLLGENNVEVKPYVNVSWAQYPPGVTVDDMGNTVRSAEATDDWTQSGSVWVKKRPVRAPVFTPNFPRSQLQSRADENHLGVGRDSAPLSSIQGTQLSILGTTIDIASFDAPDVDEPPADSEISAPLYNKSIQAFLQSSMGVNPPMQVDLPSRADAFDYAEWYFLTISTFVPLLHKPTFMTLLTRIYDEPDFKPSVAELVIVHMLYATIYFHFGVRNWQQVERRSHLNDLSNKHYHFALSKIYHLYGARELEAVQALALIASHTRAFPKPGCGTIVANMALQRALELNLHRQTRRPEEGTNLDNELRKRTWWVILTVVVAVRGRRGFPMPITVEEFDVDFPEAIADELLTEDGVDTTRHIPCPYHAGIAGFKIAPLFMEMYSNIYSVRRDVENYANIIEALERQLQAWEDALPDCLRLNLSAQLDHHHIAALYTKAFALELRLCLRHPSVAMTTDKKMMAENTRICEETSREFLHCVEQILKMKSLDTTWYQMSIYAGCIFSMLVATWERRFETTPEQVTQLRGEMNTWMAVLKETSLLLGSGPGITTEIGRIMERTIGWIEHDMQRKNPLKPHVAIAPVREGTESQQDPSTYQPTQPAQPIQPPHPNHPTQLAQPDTRVPNGTSQVSNASKSYYHEANVSGQASYPTLAYGNQPQHNAAPPPQNFQADSAMFYDSNAQEAAAAQAAAVAAVSDGSGQANPLTTFAPQPGQQAPANIMWHARGNTWNDWTAAIADSDDRYSANALLTLGNGSRTQYPPPLLANGADGQETPDMGVVPHQAQWPLLMFGNPPNT